MRQKATKIRSFKDQLTNQSAPVGDLLVRPIVTTSPTGSRERFHLVFERFPVPVMGQEVTQLLYVMRGEPTGHLAAALETMSTEVAPTEIYPWAKAEQLLRRARH